MVDDNDTNRRVLRGQLLPAGHVVETTGRAGNVVALLKQAAADGAPFDLVIADDQMPDADGSWLAQKLKSDPAAGAGAAGAADFDRPAWQHAAARRSGIRRLPDQAGARPRAARLRRAGHGRQQPRAAAHAQLVTRSSLAAERLHGHYRGRVLVAEDNIVNQQVTRRFLERLGCRVELADNGLRAVEFCAQVELRPGADGRADADHGRPDGDPRDPPRRKDGTRRMPIVALTASAMTDELDRCLAAGMDGLLTKPLQPLRLREILDRHGLGEVLAMRPARVPAADAVRAAVAAGARPGAAARRWSAMTRSSWRSCAGPSWPAAPASSRSCGWPPRARSARSSKALAHKLKGGAGSVCAPRITELSLALEHTALAAPAAELADMVEQIGSRAGRVRQRHRGAAFRERGRARCACCWWRTSPPSCC